MSNMSMSKHMRELLTDYDKSVAERQAISDAWDDVDWNDAGAVSDLEDAGHSRDESDSVLLYALAELIRKEQGR